MSETPRKNPIRINKKRSFETRIENSDKKKKKVEIPPILDFKPSRTDMKTLNDLIQIGLEWKAYEENLNKNKEVYFKIKKFKRKYHEMLDNNKDFRNLNKIVPDLKKLNGMIGMKELKMNVINQILFFIQDLQNDEMMHTVIVGPPGAGKTFVCKILGNIYKNLGILTKGNFLIAQRSDFIGEYLGSTALKTKKLLESCIGGVLFIDEAYSLGNKEKRDSFSKEAIDTLNQFLSENAKNFICIIAGYEKSLQDCFFSWNPGLERRFPWKFNVASYTIEELKDIFRFQIEENGWLLDTDENVLLDTFRINKDLFKGNGGDTLIFFDKCKIHHAKRVFGQDQDIKFILTDDDIVEGMKLYKGFKDNSLIKINPPPIGLYC
jgi:SpoVK/Ycf46/Vps4 family AAA+-type ATPase